MAYIFDGKAEIPREELFFSYVEGDGRVGKRSGRQRKKARRRWELRGYRGGRVLQEMLNCGTAEGRIVCFRERCAYRWICRGNEVSATSK